MSRMTMMMTMTMTMMMMMMMMMRLTDASVRHLLIAFFLQSGLYPP